LKYTASAYEDGLTKYTESYSKIGSRTIEERVSNRKG
jgi:hypothetical protein